MGHMGTVVDEVAGLAGKRMIAFVIVEMHTMRLTRPIDIQMAVDERRHGLH